MRQWVVAVVLVTGLIAVPMAAILWPQPSPQLEIRFYTLRSTYEIGEGVGFILENRHLKSLCYGGNIPWRVYREVSGTWELVWAARWDAATIWVLAPGESRHWSWGAGNSTGDARFAPVLPGHYRISLGGSMCETVYDYSNLETSIRFFAYFELTA